MLTKTLLHLPQMHAHKFLSSPCPYFPFLTPLLSTRITVFVSTPTLLLN